MIVSFCLILPSWHNPPTGCHSFDDHLSPNQDGGKSKNVVNLGAIRQGMKRFQFLLNCCEPGTIPDASILAAALDLVSYWKNSPTLSPILVNTIDRGKHGSLFLTPAVESLFFSLRTKGKIENKVDEVIKEKQCPRKYNVTWFKICETPDSKYMG